MSIWLWMAGCGAFRNCDEVDTSSVAELPERLSEAGLFLDPSTEELEPGVLPFEVRFALWTDGASKRRWLRLPEGQPVDTSRPDDWVFPVGTRLFKEFTRDGVRVETRMIERLDSGWSGVSYRGSEDGADAVALPEGEQDAGGTPHDIPEAGHCVACHGGRSSFVLGFSAAQLSGEEGLLDELYQRGVLSDPVTVALPGDELDQAALGYLHANCSHCHNPDRDVGDGQRRCYDPFSNMDLTLPAAVGRLQDAPALVTADSELGDADHSLVLHKITMRNERGRDPSMPPLGTEELDPEGIDLLTRWIERR
jgi:mono/diheme cytochrome c family protein